MSERLAVEFCEITKLEQKKTERLNSNKVIKKKNIFKRRELSNVMAKRKIEMDNKLLNFSIQKTDNFEQLLNKNFLGRTLTKPIEIANLENVEQDWKPFQGMISSCFDAHYDTFVNFTDQ